MNLYFTNFFLYLDTGVYIFFFTSTYSNVVFGLPPGHQDKQEWNLLVTVSSPEERMVDHSWVNVW